MKARSCEGPKCRDGRDWKKQDRVGRGGGGVGGEIVWEVVKARPGRDRGIRAPGMEDVERDLGKGKEAVPEVVGKVRVGR